MTVSDCCYYCCYFCFVVGTLWPSRSVCVCMKEEGAGRVRHAQSGSGTGAKILGELQEKPAAGQRTVYIATSQAKGKKTLIITIPEHGCLQLSPDQYPLVVSLLYIISQSHRHPALDDVLPVGNRVQLPSSSSSSSYSQSTNTMNSNTSPQAASMQDTVVNSEVMGMRPSPSSPTLMTCLLVLVA